MLLRVCFTCDTSVPTNRREVKPSQIKLQVYVLLLF